MKARLIEFGLVEIDGQRYDRDVVVERGRVSRRHKKESRPLRDRYGHTPLSLREPIPWACRRLIVGTGVDGALPIDEAVVVEAARRGVELVALPTDEACALLSEADRHDTAAILHITC
jgi:hypothetical protein